MYTMKSQIRSSKYLVLSPTEAKVVHFLTYQRDGVSISHIAQGVKLARTSIYAAIHSLAQQRIVARDKFNYTLIDKRLHRHKVKDAADPATQIKALLEEILLLKRGEIIYSIKSDEEIEYLLRKESGLPKWQREVADKGIVLKGIGSTSALRLFRSIADEPLKKELRRRSGSARFATEMIGGACMLASFRDSIVFFSRKKNFFYRIDNEEVARFTQKVIDLLYQTLRHHPILNE